MSNKVLMERPNHTRNHSISEEITALIARLGDKDGFSREAARWALVDIGKPAVPQLIRLLNDKRDQVRWEAVNAVSEVADPSSARSLVKSLEDRAFDVRWQAAEGLIRIGREAMAPTLKALISSSQADWLWEGARHVTHELATGELEPVLSPLKAAFNSDDYRTRVPIEAKAALERLGFVTGED